MKGINRQFLTVSWLLRIFSDEVRFLFYNFNGQVFKEMATLSPCLNCEERKVNCHSHCEKYLSWKAKHDKVNQLIHDYKAKNYVPHGNSAYYRRNF